MQFPQLRSFIILLSALEYGSIAYGSATDGQLKRLETIHNRGVKSALGAFCVTTTKILCESGYDNLDETRKRKLTNITLHVAENENHPVNKLLRDQEVYDEFALRRKLSKPFFIRAQEACAILGVDLGTVECVKELEHPLWINNNSDNMITQPMALPKGSGSARIELNWERY
jgi:hypothetical protein